MTPEEIARKHGRLTGYDLVDYSEIALPLWQLSVEAVSLAHRRLQPITEFVLKCLDANFAPRAIPGFLGLDPDVVRGATAQLLADRLVTAVEDSVSLTERGRRALADEGTALPIEEQLLVLFDGLTRRPAISEFAETVSSREIDDGAVVEIPSIPSRRPEISELNFADVVHFLSSQVGGRRELGRDVLRLKRISRCRRISRCAVGLVFKARHGKELRVVFVMDGAVNEELQNCFAAGGGTVRPGFVKAFSDAYVSANVRRHLGQEASRIPWDSNEHERAQQRLSLVQFRRSSLERKIQLIEIGALSENERPSPEAFKKAVAAEGDAATALGNTPVRPAAVYECAEFTRECLKSAQHAVSISSRGLAPHIVDRRLVQALRKLAAKNVAIDITLHEDSLDWARRGAAWAQAYTEINKLCLEFPNTVHVYRNREDRFFHLSWDEKVVLVCNRPFLSNHGRIKTFEQFAGFVLQRNDLVKTYMDRVERNRNP